jgi:hypothetical protein
MKIVLGMIAGVLAGAGRFPVGGGQTFKYMRGNGREASKAEIGR